jgi:hypothetical protein
VPSPVTLILSPQNSSATPAPVWAPTLTPASNEMSMLGESLKANKIVIFVLILSFSILVAGIVGFQKRKEE